MSLLDQARQAGLEVRAVGGQLLVRGPKRLGELARALLAAKAEVLAELESEARTAAAVSNAVPLTPELFRIRTVEDLLAVWDTGAPPAACYSCRSTRWWRIAGRPSIARPWACADCHPPLVPADRIEWGDGSRP